MNDEGWGRKSTIPERVAVVESRQQDMATKGDLRVVEGRVTRAEEDIEGLGATAREESERVLELAKAHTAQEIDDRIAEERAQRGSTLDWAKILIPALIPIVVFILAFVLTGSGRDAADTSANFQPF